VELWTVAANHQVECRHSQVWVSIDVVNLARTVAVVRRTVDEAEEGCFEESCDPEQQENYVALVVGLEPDQAFALHREDRSHADLGLGLLCTFGRS